MHTIIITKHFFSHPRKPILPIEMELDVLEMNGSVSSDEKAVEEHCKKMTALKEKVFNSAEENIKCAQIRYKRDYDNKHAGRRKVCSINNNSNSLGHIKNSDHYYCNCCHCQHFP